MIHPDTHTQPEPVPGGPPLPLPPTQRVSDAMVRTVLTWARNYEAIESFTRIASSGQKWQVKLKTPLLVGTDFWLRGEPQEAVPAELVFTNKEAMAFGYGCVAGGETRVPRAERRKEWDW